MIVLVYLIVLLRELLVSTIFCMVHPYITIQLFVTHIFALRRKRMRTLMPELEKVKWRRSFSCILGQ